MEHLSIQSMKTMHYVPQLDRKLLAYGVAWVALISAAMIAVAVYL